VKKKKNNIKYKKNNVRIKTIDDGLNFTLGLKGRLQTFRFVVHDHHDITIIVVFINIILLQLTLLL